MRKKYLAFALVIAITATMISGCGNNKQTKSTTETTTVAVENTSNTDNNEQTVSGKITAIDGNTITLDGGQSFELTDETNITRDFENMNGSMPTMPDGEMPSMPDGEMPTMPDGEMPTMPDGEMPSMPDGEMPSMPDGFSFDKNDKENNSDLVLDGGAAGGENSPELSFDNGDNKHDGFNPNASLSVSDLKVGDEVKVTLDDDGNVTGVAVKFTFDDNKNNEQ